VAERRSAGLVDNWLRHVEDISIKHARMPDATTSDEERGARLCELNIIEQVAPTSAARPSCVAPGIAATAWKCMAWCTDCATGCCVASV
jgi:carbonic anhydrase